MSGIKELVGIAASMNPLSLAILFIGLISPGLIWLVSIAIVRMPKSKK